MKKGYGLLLAAAGAGIAVHLLVIYYLAEADSRFQEPTRVSGKVLYSGERADSAAERLRVQQAALLDSAPLFMPTRWNQASRMDTVASLREATELFEPYAVNAGISGNLVRSPHRGVMSPGPEDWEEWLPKRGDAALALAVLGRKTRNVPPRSPQPPCIEVRTLAGKEAGRIRLFDLPAELVRRTPGDWWEPPTFFLQVLSGSRIGAPVLEHSSGYPALDRELGRFLRQSWLIHRLPDGYFRISFYP